MQNSAKITNKEVIRLLVQTAIENYAQGFQTRHEIEYTDPDGTINMKIHNVFIAALGPELQYYNALVRSLDSSLGNMLEKLAMSIAKLSFEVHKSVEGPLTIEQTQQIAEPVHGGYPFELMRESRERDEHQQKHDVDTSDYGDDKPFFASHTGACANVRAATSQARSTRRQLRLQRRYEFTA